MSNSEHQDHVAQTMNAPLPGEAAASPQRGMPVRRPAWEPKSPSIQGVRSNVMLSGWPSGDKVSAAARIERELPDVGGGAFAAEPGGVRLVLKSTIKISFSVTTRRSTCPETTTDMPPRPIEPSDDRHLGAAAARENGREPGVADQAKQVGGERVMLARSPVAGIAAEKTKRGVAPPLGRDVGQRL